MGHWDQIYLHSRAFNSHRGQGSSVRHSRGGDDFSFEPRFRCPSCKTFQIPTLRCDACGTLAEDANELLTVTAYDRRWMVRMQHLRAWRARGPEVVVSDEASPDSTPENPHDRTVAFASESANELVVIAGPITLRESGDPHRASAWKLQTPRILFYGAESGGEYALRAGDRVWLAQDSDDFDLIVDASAHLMPETA